jgi:serine/threonine-protein phosphatase 2B regulatory subunit
MGNNKSLLADFQPLNADEIEELCRRYRFTKEEIVTMHKYFTVIAGSVEDDGVIDINEFQAALGFANSVFAERIFCALDEDKSDKLEFGEFVNGFYLLSPMASKEEKVHFTFRIYDVDGNGAIDEEELFLLLRDVIRSDTSVNVHFRDSDLRDWVGETFAKMCPEGKKTIEMDEYRKMVEKHPGKSPRYFFFVPLADSGAPVVLQALTIPMNFLRDIEDEKWERKFLARAEVKQRRMSVLKSSASMSKSEMMKK